MLSHKLWCNMCIDLVAFTSEIFRGAVFQSLDGIIISANCKLRKIFTLKSKPQDTAEEDDMCVVPFMPYEPTDVIPRSCQLNTDVPQVTQLLNLTKIHKPEIKCRRYPVTVQETGSLVNRGQGNIRSTKTQHVSHIAFGSKILGPPPSSNRRVSARVSGEVRRLKLQKKNAGTSVKEEINNTQYECSQAFHKLLGCISDPAIQTQKTSESGRADFQLASPQGPLADKNSHRRLSLKNAAKNTWEITSGIVLLLCYFTSQLYEWVFPESFTESVQLDRSEQCVATEDSACHNLTSPQNVSVEHHSNETGDHQVNNKEIFTFSSRPRSAPHGKSPNMSPEYCIFPLDLKQDSNGVHGKTEIEDDFQGTDSSEEVGHFISHSRQGTSDSAIFKEIPLKSMSWRNEYWKNKRHSKHNLEDTILSKPQSSTVRKPDSVSSQGSLKPTLSLSPTASKTEFFKVIPNGSERYEGVSGQLKRSVSKKSLKKISRENSCLTTQTCEYDWKNYQSDRLSSSELQMLASMKRQQNEELQDTGISHGLSASQIDNCNVSMSTSSDDTATWNSGFPPVSLNPQDWLNLFSPPIVPGSQQLEEHTKSSTNQSIPGEDLNAEDDEEVLTLLYDPCLNCYFDPDSGKYYELA
uniref:CFAP20 domain containing n=1 Tax=Buteo japonicus TaxID=224669 RepID=A0A8C0BHJ9_9AVES